MFLVPNISDKDTQPDRGGVSLKVFVGDSEGVSWIPDLYLKITSMVLLIVYYKK
jgi:hypothetical protein